MTLTRDQERRMEYLRLVIENYRAILAFTQRMIDERQAALDELTRMAQDEDE